MRPQNRTVDQIIARIAGLAHGVVTWAEMRCAEVTVAEIKRRAKKGVLIRQYPGVYRVGHVAPSVEATFVAAVKACGKGAVLSGRAAGYLWGLLKGKPPPPEVTAPTERRVKGIKTRRSRRVQPTTYRGIPVTTVAQTLVDLAADLAPDELARACHEAGVRYRTTPRQVDAVLARYPNAPGAGRLRAVMRGDTPVTLSVMERMFVEAVKGAGLPLPETNRAAGGRRVDCRWPGRLTVELDSYRFHNSRWSWEQGQVRAREARARREEFRRYTWTDVTDERDAMLAEIAELLARPSSAAAA